MAQGNEAARGAPSLRARVERAAGALVELQLHRPHWLLLFALATIALSGFAASRLTLKTSFGELLPQNKNSVIVADRVSQRLVSASTLVVVAQNDDAQALKRFIDALAPEIRALGPSVGAVDDGVRASREFFEHYQILYAPLADVEKVHDEILERYEYEVLKQNDGTLENENAPPPITAESIRQHLEERTKKK